MAAESMTRGEAVFCFVSAFSYRFVGKKTKVVKITYAVEGRPPAARLPAGLVVARGERGDVKSLGRHRRSAQAAL